MNRKTVVTIGAVAFCFFAGMAAARFDLDRMGQAAAVSEPAEGIAKEQTGEAAALRADQPLSEADGQEEPLYWLRAADGRLGVFLEDSDQPEMILDVYLSSLPLSDQQALQAGVCAGSYRQLVLMIEDYIS